MGGDIEVCPMISQSAAMKNHRGVFAFACFPLLAKCACGHHAAAI
jgi:hypothetical protein